jgi:hypothetical protein
MERPSIDSRYKFIKVIILAMLLLPFGSFGSIRVSAQGTGPQPGSVEAGQDLDNSAEGLEMSVEAGFGGRIKRGKYFPVSVTIENTGRDHHGEIHIISEDTIRPLTAMFTAVADIPANSKKTYSLYPFFMENDTTPAIFVQFVEKGKVKLVVRADLTMLDENDKLWVEVSDEGYDFPFIGSFSVPPDKTFTEIAANIPEQANSYWGSSYNTATDYYLDSINMVGVKASSLPQRIEGYQAIDGLILNSRRFYDLSENQHIALGEFVLSGGSMIMWLGDDPLRYQNSFISRAYDGSGRLGPSLLYNEPTRTNISMLSTIPGFVGQNPMIGNFPVTFATQSNARTLFEESGIPVLQHIKFGLGNVLMSGLDLASLKAGSFLGMDNYLAFMIGYLDTQDKRLDTSWVQTYPSNNYYSGSASPAFNENSYFNVMKMWDNSLQTDNLTKLPDLSGIALFLASYVILIGPVNYFILLRLRRREWLWYTIPFIVTIFCVFAYGWALGTKGSKLLLTRLNVEDAYPDYGIMWQQSVFGLFSPSPKSYEIHMGDDTDLIRTFMVPESSDTFSMGGTSVTFDAGNMENLVQDGRNGESYIEDSRIEIWAERHYESNGSAPFSGIATIGDLTMSEGTLSGRLTYDLESPLYGARLWYPINGGFNLGDVPSDESNAIMSGEYQFELNTDVTPVNLPQFRRFNDDLTLADEKLANACLSYISARNAYGTFGDEIILAGWDEDPTVRPVEKPGVRSIRQKTLVLIHIPVSIVSREKLLEGVRYDIISIAGTELKLEPPRSLNMENGQMMFMLSIPPGTLENVEGNNVEIRIHYARKNSDPLVHLFNYRDGIWEIAIGRYQLENQEEGYLSVTLRNAENSLGPDGRMLPVIITSQQENDDEVISLTNITIHGK